LCEMTKRPGPVARLVREVFQERLNALSKLVVHLDGVHTGKTRENAMEILAYLLRKLETVERWV
jgi:hypothetical protein